MNLIEQIKNKRDVGIVRSHEIEVETFRWNEILTKLELIPDEKRLIKIDRDEAIEILKVLLSKDMAYKSEIMKIEESSALSQNVIDSYSSDDTEYFTNGHWNEREKNNGFTWNPMTEATFDGGIIIKRAQKVISIWFEDED
jgi:hypothetical protein